jgi:hypothetical protein
VAAEGLNSLLTSGVPAPLGATDLTTPTSGQVGHASQADHRPGSSTVIQQAIRQAKDNAVPESVAFAGHWMKAVVFASRPSAAYRR